MIEYFKDFIACQKSRNIAVRSVQTLEYQAASFIEWLKNIHNVNDPKFLNRTHIKSYQLYLASSVNKHGLPLKPNYLNTIIWSVKSFLDYLYKENVLQEKLADKLSLVNVPKRLPRGMIEYDEFQRLISSIDISSLLGVRDRAIIELLYTSGIRVCEIHRLDISDIDLVERSARVLGKGNKERMVVFGKDAARSLENYMMAVRPFMRGANQTKSLFISRRGNRLHISVYQRMIQKLAKKAGIDHNISPHTFRRSCTTELVRANANLYHVKELLGHESLDTLKHYAKLNVGDLKKMIKDCHPRS